MTTCPNCGCRVYALGCVNCDESAYIEQQQMMNDRDDLERLRESALEKPYATCAEGHACGWTFDFGQRRVFCRECEPEARRG